MDTWHVLKRQKVLLPGGGCGIARLARKGSPGLLDQHAESQLPWWQIPVPADLRWGMAK